jgi:hypothetical protein
MHTRRIFFTAGALALALLSGCGSSGDVKLEEVVNTGSDGPSPQLLRGFHPVEEGSWRWTQSKFSVALKPPRQVSQGAVLVLRYSLPEPALATLKEVTISSTIEGIPLPPEKCSETGMRELRREVPADVLQGKRAVTVDFAVDPFLPAGASDRRELGLIVHSIGLLKK